MTPADRRRAVNEVIGNEPDDFTPEDLRRIASGGIMDPARIYCPAGRLTWAEVRAREAAQVKVEKP